MSENIRRTNNQLISIIIPFYDRASLLIETLNSIINQNNGNWECIIVDDGSTDNSIDIISKYTNTDERIKLFKRALNPKGASVCRNIGAQNARGDYLVFLDSDDIITPEFVGERIAQIKFNPDLDFIVFPSCFFYKVIGDNDKIWNVINKNNISDLCRFFNGDTPWPVTGPVWKKSAFLKIGGFYGPARSGQDWEIHTKALLNNLKYKKVADKRDNLHHFVRKGDHESINDDFDSKEKILDRFSTYEYILDIAISSDQLSKNVRISIIRFFYRNSEAALAVQLNSEAEMHLRLLHQKKLISGTLLQILLLRLRCWDSTQSSCLRLADFLLYHIYKIDNIDIPVNRTKGGLSYQS